MSCKVLDRLLGGSSQQQAAEPGRASTKAKKSWAKARTVTTEAGVVSRCSGVMRRRGSGTPDGLKFACNLFQLWDSSKEVAL